MNQHIIYKSGKDNTYLHEQGDSKRTISQKHAISRNGV